MVHTESCEMAKGHVCKCTGCGGALHGWVGGLILASPDMGSKRDERRVEINRKWEQYLNLNRDKKSKIEAREVRAAKAASADSARLDIINWLARRWPDRTDHNKRSSVELEDIAAELAPVSKGMRELAKKLGTIT